ncbi:hypothetical protein E4T49_03641 [Aureobasidium sp. EXF-10728]|nr:hypothetical protein E4T49_03641 [Aureobasidium sp. EXF-10728]
MAPRFGQSHALYPRDTVALPAKLLPAIPTCAQSCVSSQVADVLHIQFRSRGVGAQLHDRILPYGNCGGNSRAGLSLVLFVQQCSGSNACCVDYDNFIPADNIDIILSNHSADLDTYDHHIRNIGVECCRWCTYIECNHFIIGIANWFLSSTKSTLQTFVDWSITRSATSSGPARPPRSFPASPNKSPRSSLSSFDKSPEATTQRRFRPSLRPQMEWWKQSSRLDIRQVPDGLKSHRASISSPGRSETRSPRLPNPTTNITINVKKASKHLRPDSAATRWTVFEEDSRTPTHKHVLPDPPVLPKPVFLLPIRPPPGPSFADQYTTSPEEMTKSGLMLQIPRKPVRNDEPSLPNGISLNMGASRNDHLSMPPSSAASYLPAYYTSSDSRTPVAPKWSPNDHERFSQPHFAPLPLMPRGVRSSWASATTFESVDPDETTPENEVDKQLSPVSYPKVPRPSNQAIPRSPPSTTSSRKVTLAAKRRGEDLSLDLDRGLMITNIREAPESPLRNYSRRHQKKNDQTPQMELKSPLWQPELTPSRRGDDLYLSVEVKGRSGKVG